MEMRKPSDYKLVARQRMFNKYGILASGTVIYGAIMISIFMAILVVYSMNLLTKGVFNSMETMQAYIDNMATSYTYSVVYELAVMLIGALLSTVSVAVQYMCLKTARNQEVKISDMLYVVKNNPDKVIIIYIIQQLLMFLFNLPANIIAIIANKNLQVGMWEVLYFVFMILGYLADIIIITLLSQAMFIYLDNPQEGSLNCIEASVRVMKNNFQGYIRLLISFIPLQLMGVFTLGIGYIWVIPYQNTTFALFYMKLKGEFGSTIDVSIQ